MGERTVDPLRAQLDRVRRYTQIIPVENDGVRAETVRVIYSDGSWIDYPVLPRPEPGQ